MSHAQEKDVQLIIDDEDPHSVDLRNESSNENVIDYTPREETKIHNGTFIISKGPLRRQTSLPSTFNSGGTTASFSKDNQEPSTTYNPRPGTSGSKRSRSGSAKRNRLGPVALVHEKSWSEHVAVLRHFLETNGFGCTTVNDSTTESDLMSGVHVVILCLTKSFSSSQCSQLALNAWESKKFVIPICLEKVAWPPSGPLQKNLEELLFLRFYKGPQDNSNSAFYWPEAKIRELSGMLQELLKSDKKLRASSVKVSAPQQPGPTGEPTSYRGFPQIFLSYQWKHQKDVTELQEFLQSNDITCAISSGEISATASSKLSNDEAIKNAQVVILCVNTLYPHSKQCTKEVFQARGMKKPIIVLLMEPIHYPPDGKQEFILKKYLPLTFFRGYKQKMNETSWPGQRYLTLVRKIKETGLKFPQSEDLPFDWSKESEKQVAAVLLKSTHLLSHSKRYSVVISCSPCAMDLSEKLAAELCSAGYATAVADYTSDSVNHVKFKALICVLTKRYCSSSMAGNEIVQASMKLGHKPIVPLLLEKDQEYPPQGSVMTRALANVRPVNCKIIASGLRQWKGSIQLQNIIDRLETINVSPNDQDNVLPDRTDSAEGQTQGSLPLIKSRPFTAPSKFFKSNGSLKNSAIKRMQSSTVLPHLSNGKMMHDEIGHEKPKQAFSKLPMVAE